MPREKKKGGRGFLRWILTLLVLGVLALVGLSQLPRLGIDRLSDLIPTTGSPSEEPVDNPAQELLQGDQADHAPESSSGQDQGALIRIE